MDLQQRSLRMGALVLAGAVLLRLLGGGLLGTAVKFLATSEVAAVLLYLETGRLVRLPDDTETDPPDQTAPEDTPPGGNDTPVSPETEFMPAVFVPEDAALVDVNSLCSYTVDTEELLMEPLIWNLAGEEPTVLILHSHATESYENTEGYQASSSYRTLDENYNMVSVGDRLVELLEAQGISVIHDRSLHDYPSYNGSYENARSSIEKYLEEYPSIRLVLDMHRDAVADSSGDQLSYRVSSDGRQIAQLMMVMGSDAGGLMHPAWQENMSLAVKLYAQLEKTCPGICRPISLRSQRFNQDLSTGALLIEVGAAGNTRQEALGGAEILAEAIIALSRGTVS